MGELGKEFQPASGQRVLLYALVSADLEMLSIVRCLLDDEGEIYRHARRQTIQGFDLANLERHDHRVHVTGYALAGREQDLMGLIPPQYRPRHGKLLCCPDGTCAKQ